MSASKPLLVLLFPAIFAVPVVFTPAAHAQEKTAQSAPAQSTAAQSTAAQSTAAQSASAALTAPAKPASTIAPRQSLPTFTSAKATVAPAATLPSGGQPITPPVPAKVPVAAAAATSGKAPVKEAAVPKPQPKAVAGTWSARENPTLATPAPLAATPRISAARGRRAFAAEVSLATSPMSAPAAPIQLTPRIAPAATLTPVKALEALPKVAEKPVAEKPVAARAKALASREARARELKLARLDAQLAGAEARLDRAQSNLTEGQRQLGSVNNLLQNAMLSSGGSGLHPFVRVAQRYLGTPYVWGGESARGFDCSGFIMRVMRDLGYKALPHSAAEQFNYGKPVAKNLLQPGDIVFFANTYKPGISHVGIYLGGGRFIHAANSQVGTIVSNLNESKWIAKYAGARRLMKAS